jgi:hypothetical protein
VSDNVQIDVEQLPFQQIPNWVFESEISPTAVKLYLVLRKNGDNKRGTSYYSRKKLAIQLGTSANTMDRAKSELIAIGALCQINRKNEQGDWTSNMYHVHTSSNQNCRYLLSKLGTPIPTDGDTPIPIDGEQTNNHIELRTKELTSRTYGDDVVNACNLFADLIESNGIKRPNVTDKWLQEMERINRIDGYSWSQIDQTIRWVTNDSFWKSNVLSPNKLRKQFGALQLKQNNNSMSSWSRVIMKLSETGTD